MKSTPCASVVISALLSAASAFAGQPALEYKESKIAKIEEPAPRYLNDFLVSSSYVSESEIEGEPGFGEQDVFHVYGRYAHRFPLDGLRLPAPREDGFWALRVGAVYERFDFGSTSGPLPTTLQSAAGIIGLEYKVGYFTGFLIESRPGVYFSDDIESGSFDAPTNIGLPIAIGNMKDERGEDRLFLIVGASFSMLRSYPVIPVVGVHWRISDEWTLQAYLPEPRITYTAPSRRLSAYVGGELAGGSFKTKIENAKPSKLDDAVVTYSEYRAGGGIAFQPCPQWDGLTVDIAGGWAFERNFDFHRADKEYSAEGAPYVKLEIRGQF